jgi:DNA-binding CsgD family transcriptional regulator
MATPELRVEVLRRLRRVMHIDAAFFASADPDTLLFTGAVQESPLDRATPLFLENEYGTPDVNKFSALAAARDPVMSLDAATNGDRSRSARYRDIMAPLGLGDEMRVALRDGGTTWGFLCLHREDGAAGFTPDELRAAVRLAPHIGRALRLSMLVDASAAEPTVGPGVIVLSDDLSVVATTPAAEPLLQELAVQWPRAQGIPVPVMAVAARVRHGGGADHDSAAARVRLRTAANRWLTLHAAHLAGDTSGIVVVIEPSRADEAVPVMLAALGLTHREAEVAMLIVRGCSTRQVMQALEISQHTVQDHLKAVFDKAGVRSRRELVARLMHPEG